MTDDERGDHWPHHARHWALLTPPLRPSPEDTAFVALALAEVPGLRRAVVLGVTSELLRVAPEVIAVDDSAAMIAMSATTGAPACVRADWRAMPLATASVDAVVGDGSTTCIAFPRDYVQLADELARVLRPGGALVLRLFASPVRRETLADIAAAIHARAIHGFHAAKWRVAMAIADADHNVAVTDIVRAFDELAPDHDALAAHTGWPRAQIATIDAYRTSRIAYSFPPRADALAVLAPRFAVHAVHTPSYELGERCPTVVLRRV